jgi:hypothetical protein
LGMDLGRLATPTSCSATAPGDLTPSTRPSPPAGDVLEAEVVGDKDN